MKLAPITRRVVRVLVALHRKAVVHDVREVQKQHVAALNVCDHQEQVIARENERFTRLLSAAAQRRRNLQVAELAGESELDVFSKVK